MKQNLKNFLHLKTEKLYLAKETIQKKTIEANMRMDFTEALMEK